MTPTVCPFCGRPTARAEAAHGLTPRQVDAVKLIALGCTNSTAAEIMDISPFTVSDHLKAVYIKWHIRSRAALALKAHEFGLTKGQ
jgi:DNA-binding CsgD family transcriptional regulator